MSRPKKLKFNLTNSDSYHEYFITGALGGMNPNKCSITIFHDKPVLTIPEGSTNKINVKEINREVQATINMTPTQFKQMAMWMSRTLQAYEKRFGKIEHIQNDDSPQPGFIS